MSQQVVGQQHRLCLLEVGITGQVGLAILVGSQIWHDCSDASDWDTDAILREMAEKCNQNMTLLTAEEESKCEEMLARLASEDEAQQLQASKEIHDAVAWAAVRSLR